MTQNDLVLKYIPLVHSIANRLNVPHLKDDLVGEGMIVLVKSAANYDPSRGVTFGQFTKKTIRQVMIKYLKKNSNHNTVYLDDKDDTGASYYETIGRDGQADTTEFRDALAHYLHPVEEWVVTKRYFEKMSVESIATELGFNVSRVSLIHSNAIKKLKVAFDSPEVAPQEEEDNNQNNLLQVVRKMIWDEWGVEVVEI